MLIRCFCSAISSLGGKKKTLQDYISSFYLIFFLFMLSPKSFRILGGWKGNVHSGRNVPGSLTVCYTPSRHWQLHPEVLMTMDPIIQCMRPCHAAMFSELKQPLLRAGSWRPIKIKKISKAQEQSDSQGSGSSWILQGSQGPSWGSVGGNGNRGLETCWSIEVPTSPSGSSRDTVSWVAGYPVKNHWAVKKASKVAYIQGGKSI